MTLWHGRFAESPSDDLLNFTSSLTYDKKLAPYDIACSRAHARMLADQAIIEDDDLDAILLGLAKIEEELDHNNFVFLPTDEDIHTAIERRLTEISGDAGKKLHTGRSRNDQIATDVRLYVREVSRKVAGDLLALCEVLLMRAREGGTAYLPGYTHLQQAQSMLLSHHLLAHFWRFARDIERWRVVSEHAAVSPLGAAAAGGTRLPIDPIATARYLGISETFKNSLDAVSDRDFAAEALFAAALAQVHLSSLGEELVIWNSSEFGFVSLPDEYATGSSMLPQKKNPDVAELARGKAGRVIGNLTGLLTTLKGLPLAYNRDLQEDKEGLFDSIDTLQISVCVMSALIEKLDFDTERMAELTDPFLTAIDVAELLVERGYAFRSAHETVGRLVQRSIDEEVNFETLVRDEFGEEIASSLSPSESIQNRRSPGGSGYQAVVKQMKEASAFVEEYTKLVGTAAE